MLFCRLLIFFQNQLFRKILSGIPLACQTVWIQIRPDILFGLIWVQTVCKSYQQTTLIGKEFRHHLQIISFQLQGGGDMSLLKNFNTQAVRQGFVIDDVSSLLKGK